LKIAVHHLNSAVRKYLKNRGHKNLEEQVWHSYYKNPY